jgi:hypothetical protein
MHAPSRKRTRASRGARAGFCFDKKRAVRRWCWMASFRRARSTSSSSCAISRSSSPGVGGDLSAALAQTQEQSARRSALLLAEFAAVRRETLAPAERNATFADAVIVNARLIADAGPQSRGPTEANRRTPAALTHSSAFADPRVLGSHRQPARVRDAKGCRVGGGESVRCRVLRWRARRWPTLGSRETRTDA